MPLVVKIKTSDRGEKYKYAKWCYVDTVCAGDATFCKGEYFGEGESGCEYEIKEGKITCPDCIERIKAIKKIKL